MRRSLLVVMLALCWLVPAANASAADDRIVIVGSVLVDRGETAGDVVVVDGDVTVRGEVKGDLVVVDGNATIRGKVSGDVLAISGLVTLGRRGSVDGNISYGDDKPVRTPGSHVGGKVEKIDITAAGVIGAIGFLVAMTVSLFLLGLILLLLAPRAADAVARTARTKALLSAGVGLLTFIVLPLIAIAALLTVVGIPLGVVLLALLVPLYAIAYVTTAFVLGRRIIKGARILAFLAGLVILTLVSLIPVAGGIVVFLALVFGLGVLIVSLLGARS